MTLFIEHPWLALLAALGYGGLWQACQKKIVLVTAWLWAAYAVYEYLMQARLLCSGECNIRVDLLLLYPLLLAMSLWALLVTIASAPMDR